MAANTHSISLVRASTQSLSITDASQTGLDITGDLTFEAWINPSTLPANTGSVGTFWIMGKRGGGGQRGYRFGMYQESSVHNLIVTLSDDGSAETSKIVSWTPSTSTWFHVAFVYTASAGTVSFYVNGTQQGSTQTSMPTSIFDNNAPFVIGSQEVGASIGFDGLIDEVRVWNVGRTKQQIQDNLINDVTGQSGLVAYWKLDNNYNDSSANSNTLTPNNTPTFSTTIRFEQYKEKGLIVTELLTSNNTGTDADSYDTASISPTEGRLVVLIFSSNLGTGNADFPSSVSGGGVITWNLQHQFRSDNTIDQVSVYSGVAIGGSGAITVSFPATQNGARWSVFELDNFNRKNPFVQIDHNVDTSVSSIQVDLDPFSFENNASFGGIALNHNPARTITVGSGFTQIHNTDAVENRRLQSQWRNDPDTSVDWTLNDTANQVYAVAFEIAHRDTEKKGGGFFHFM